MVQLKKIFCWYFNFADFRSQSETAKMYCLKVIANQPSEMLIRHFEPIL